MNSTKNGKKAILFGGTDGHGVTMTALSERSLKKDGYNCTTVCEFVPAPKREQVGEKNDWGTSNAALFWGVTFPSYPFDKLSEGDLVVVVDIPIGVDDRFPDCRPDSALECIGNLTKKGIRVQVIDHHKMTVTYYGKAREAGAEIVISSSAATTHYGTPDAFSLGWGRIGAISDRDNGELPVKSEEEALSASLDEAVRTRDPPGIPSTLEVLSTENDKDILDYLKKFYSTLVVPEKIDHNKHVVEICDHLQPGYGNKVLGAACEKYNVDYGIGRTDGPNPAILVVTGWKTNALPGALRLGLSSWKGHPDAFFTNFKSEEELENALVKWRTQLSSPDPNVGDIRSISSVNRSENYYKVIAAFMRKVGKGIAPYLTTHGWPHVANVLANTRTLGSLFNLSEEDQYLLDWAALLHDVGRGALEVYQIKMDDSDTKKAEKAEKADVDNNHHLYSVMMIREWAQKGLFSEFLNEDEVDIVADLCLRHRQKIKPPNEPERLRKLCILLKVADAMDIDKRRAQKNDQEEFYEDIKDKLPEDSGPHWRGHRAIKAIRTVALPDSINFELIVTNPEEAKFQIELFNKEIENFKQECHFYSSISEVNHPT